MLVASRFAQGAGEALAAPASLGLIALLFSDPQERIKALGLWGGIARADVSDLDLDRLALVAGLVFPTALDELAGNEVPHALLERAASVLGDRAPCCAAEEPVVDVMPLAIVLGAVAHRDGEACEGRAALGVANLGIVGDVSD